MNEMQKKVCKVSKIMATITKVLSISLIVGMVIPLTILIWYYINPSTNFTAMHASGFYSATGLLFETTGEVIAEMWIAIISGAFVLRIFIIAYQMFKSISINIMPFSEDNVKRLKHIGAILLIYSLIEPISRKGFYSSYAPEITIRSSLDTVSVILALAFFFIAIIFDYGAELQRFSDETL